MEITIVENLQRADLNPMEQARAFERLGREFHMTCLLYTSEERRGSFFYSLSSPEEGQCP